MALIPFIIIILLFAFRTKNGYYNYGNEYYYLQGNSWYLYNGYGWLPTTAPSELKDHASDYYDSSSYDSNSGISDFKDSVYYRESSSDDSWDSDSSWSSGDSWDSGGTDWSSDW